MGGFPWNGVFPLHNQPHIHLISRGYFLDPNPLGGGLIPRDFPTIFLKEISGSSVRIIPFSKYLVSPIYEPFAFFAIKGSLRNPRRLTNSFPRKPLTSPSWVFHGKKDQLLQVASKHLAWQLSQQQGTLLTTKPTLYDPRNGNVFWTNSSKVPGLNR